MQLEEEEYIHFHECISSLNRCWVVIDELCKSDHSPIIFDASYRMALIEYSKPFKVSRGVTKRHRLSLPSLSEDQAVLHDRILKLRDTFLAHSDLVEKDAKIYQGKEMGLPLPVIISNTSPLLPDKQEVKALVEFLLDNLYGQTLTMAAKHEKP